MRRLGRRELQAFAAARDDHIFGFGLDLNSPPEPFSPLELLEITSTDGNFDNIETNYNRLLYNAIDYIFAENKRLARLGLNGTDADLRPILFLEHILVLEPIENRREPPGSQKRKWRDAKANGRDIIREDFDLAAEEKRRRVIMRPTIY